MSFNSQNIQMISQRYLLFIKRIP